ncbi:MAG: D-alanine--D-alanine ligase [Gammaproteobacteria bacterium]|nr:D-alanine--D-alanine ligase [Gammaproteobacteria bacterium]
MKQSDKIRVAVLYGGRSAEHEISLQSAANVIQHLDPSLFEVVPIGIDRQGNWFLGNEVFSKSLEHKKVPKLSHEMNTWFTPEWVGKPVSHQTIQALSAHSAETSSFDVVFPVVHGTLCEDGTLQGLLELAGLPYVGCGVLSSAIGMDKDVSKRLAQAAGIRIAPYLTLKHHQWQTKTDFYLKEIAENFSFPLFVKPANTGSSIGISKVKNLQQLPIAIQEAFKFDTKIIIEKALNVRELEVAVLEPLASTIEPIVSVIGEIKPRHEFYSYEAKYLDDNGAELIIPAAISDELKVEAASIAKKLFTILECEGMARVDLFLCQDTKQIYFNEVNTIPGFTTISMYPKLMAASGISYEKLLTHLIQLALARHKSKTQLSRNYVG